MTADKEFSGYDPTHKPVVHCGGCVITRGQMMARQRAADMAGCPMTNYGVAISLVQGILPRVLDLFPKPFQCSRLHTLAKTG
ncbi:hypothetical protein HNQ38_001752 [Desulfovibrio intestinalis]|uniref:Hydrogen maturase F tetramerization domain-containing protein n=1 Tax=Desulfovibrio intestinalis TaxID=58621 RepID=A0A7W8C4M0_9BACT|nr:hypothetical protein [Desulfovibrio intestinalis]